VSKGGCHIDLSIIKPKPWAMAKTDSFGGGDVWKKREGRSLFQKFTHQDLGECGGDACAGAQDIESIWRGSLMAKWMVGTMLFRENERLLVRRSTELP